MCVKRMTSDDRAWDMIESMGKQPNTNQSYVKNGEVHDKQVITSEAEMYIISSMGGRSLGNGNRFWTSSSSDKPVDHTSDRMV